MYEEKSLTVPATLPEGAPDGTLEAVFSTFDIVDSDGDIVAASAFTDGQQVPLTWAHDWTQPVGKGVIRVMPDRAVFAGQFFLDTAAGREAYQTVKNMGDLQEYSWGFRVLNSDYAERDGQDVRVITKAEVYEVSPVLVGANRQTGTLALKRMLIEAKGAIGYQKTATSDAGWDGPANEARLSNDAGAATYRQAFAWVDPDADPDTKAAYKFIHHEVGTDGKPGAANIKACQTAIGVLNGGRGGASIPASDREGVYRHLAHHLRDAGLDPAPLKSHSDGQTFADEADAALAAVSHLAERAKALAAMRAKDGRMLSAANVERLQSHAHMLHQVSSDLMDLCAQAAPKAATVPRETVEALRILSRMNGVPV